MRLSSVYSLKTFACAVTSLGACLSPFFSSVSYGMGNDDPLLTKVLIDKLETADSVHHPVSLESDIWLGHDLNKFWLKTDAEYSQSTTEHLQLQALYSRAISPYWDMQFGLSYDRYDDADTQNTALTENAQEHLTRGVIAFNGLAPYMFDIDASLYIDDEAHTSLNVSAEYELLFTQKLILSPEIGLQLNSHTDKTIQQGQGLAQLDLGLRLRYEFRRQIAPYLGLTWQQWYGDTAELKGEESDAAVVAGVRVWF